MKEGRRYTGGKYKSSRKKKKYENHGQQIKVRLGKEKRKSLRITGGNKKTVLLKGEMINVLLSPKKIQKTKINKVIETPSNKFLVRQNILTKGTIVETELGKVKITNRPSQESIINGILVK